MSAQTLTHRAVLLAEAVEALALRPDGTYTLSMKALSGLVIQ